MYGIYFEFNAKKIKRKEKTFLLAQLTHLHKKHTLGQTDYRQIKLDTFLVPFYNSGEKP